MAFPPRKREEINEQRYCKYRCRRADGVCDRDTHGVCRNRQPQSQPERRAIGAANQQRRYRIFAGQLRQCDQPVDVHSTYYGLTGNATAAHFHGPADPDKTAGVIVPVQGSVASPIDGTATLTDTQAADLLAGKWYFNIHTEANWPGEIRGQVTK